MVILLPVPCLKIDNYLLTFLRKSRTCLTSHTDIYLGLGGLKLNTADTNEQILGCFLTGKPLIYSWKAEIPDLCKFVALYSLFQRRVKYYIISFTGAKKG